MKYGREKIIVKERTVGAYCHTPTGDKKQAVLERAQFIVSLHLNPSFFNAIPDTQYDILTTKIMEDKFNEKS